MERRIRHLELALVPPDSSPTHIVVTPDRVGNEWPAEDQAALTGDDDDARDAVIERHTGQRPGPYTRLIVLRYGDD